MNLVDEDVTQTESSVACLYNISDRAGGWGIDCPRRRGRSVLSRVTKFRGSSNAKLCSQYESTDGLMELPKLASTSRWSCVGPGGR